MDSPFADWAFIGMGSNLGRSAVILRQAAEALRGWSRAPLLLSSWWRSAPVDCPPGSPDFINAVAGLLPQPTLSPERMLAALQRMEGDFGRGPRSVKHEPRALDLDLLVFGREVRATERLSLPHPRAHLRRFVLEPWAEVAPELVLPVVGRSVSELLRNLPPGQQVERAD